MKAGYLADTILHSFCTCIEVLNFPNDNIVLNVGWMKKEWSTPEKNTVGYWKIKK